MTHYLGQLMSDERFGLRRRIVAVCGMLIAANLLAWAWTFAAFGGQPVLLGTAFLAYSLGLRHALDADHIAAIDNATRKLMQEGKRPVAVGLFFALGHATVVMLASIAVGLAAHAASERFAVLREFGGVVGTLASALFLFAISIANLTALHGLYRAFRRAKAGEELREEDIDTLLAQRGWLARLFRPLFGLVSTSWHLYPIGLLFALGFETATEISLFGISAEASKGIGSWSILIYPALFTAAMTLVDTADGIVMLGAYGWAYVRPMRKLFYNLTITSVSVLVAVVIGGIEALGLMAGHFRLTGVFWDAISGLNQNFGLLGYGIVALFAASWGASMLIYRCKGYDRYERRLDIKRLAIVGLVVLAAAPTSRRASAADVAPAMPLKAPVSAPGFDWNGFYFGGHVGYAAGTSAWAATEAGGATPTLAGSLDFFNSYDAFTGTGSYFIGLQAGYNYTLPSGLVLGIEADSSAPAFPAGISASQTFSSSSGDQASYGETVLQSGTVRARVGRTFGDNWLVYGTGGFAWSYDRLIRTQIAGSPAGGSATAGMSESALLWRLGWVAGAGIEVPVAPNWTAKLEYLYGDYGRDSVTFPAAGQRFDSDFTMQSIRLGMNYQLGADPAKSDLLTKGISPPDLDRFNLHGQTTFVEQYAFPFRAPYSGTNSLASNSGRETWDMTFYAGFRLWEGAELWINPEIDQGFGLSGSVGAAGFPSGEAYKVGFAYPYARLPRAFVRQTIDLGGESQKVEAGINQFAGSQTADRLVITAGKFSVTDVFDTNRYAHDPRSDFLNWALADTGTFDYAADAWAYTYGGAVEWYQGRWTLRGGVFDMSIAPNTTDLDPTFHQFQMVGEIERRHELWGQPGKIAITGYLTRGRMGRYDDAVQLALATGGPADIAAVRRYTSRPGISFNLEQQLTRNIGLFARGGVTSGTVEPYEFTDIDRTLAGGLVFSGSLWGRADDTIGLAGIINGISSAHRAFLNAGGLGILVGDGMLPHYAPERIIETYYSLPLYTWRVTFDYQFIDNPAYNNDRGPVSVIAMRLHSQF